MLLTDNVIVVFQKQNLDKAIAYCRLVKRDWTVICAFEIPAGTLQIPEGVLLHELFSCFPYQPRVITERVRDIINAFYDGTYLNGTSLSTAMKLEGVPLLRAKDNEIMEYTLHRLVFVFDVLLRELGKRPVAEVCLLVDRDSEISVPEWPNFERWLDLDAFYGPVFSRVARAAGLEVKLLSLVNMRSRVFVHRLREFALIGHRLQAMVRRILTWRKVGSEESSSHSGAPKLAIWVRSKGQVREIEPIVRQWLEDGRVAPLFIQDDSFKKQDCITYLGSQPDLPFESCYRYVSLGDFAKAIGRYLAFRFFAVNRLTYATPEKNLGAIETVLLSPEFRKALAKSLSEAVVASSLVTKALSRCHDAHKFGAMVVMSNYDLWGHLSGYLGRHKGFKTISLQNFMTDPWAYPTPYTLYEAHVVYDEVERQRVIASGALPERVHALGGSLYGSLRNPEQQKLRYDEVRARLKIHPKQKVLLLGTQSASADAVGENKQCLMLLFDIISRHKDVVGLVKTHPYEKLADYKDWIDRAQSEGLPIQFYDHLNIDDLIAASDIYISRTSTTMILSVMLRKPTISFVNLFEKPRAIDAVDFIRTSIVPIFTDYSEASDWLECLLDDENHSAQVQRQEAILASTFTTYDEFGADRIKNFIETHLSTDVSGHTGK